MIKRICILLSMILLCTGCNLTSKISLSQNEAIVDTTGSSEAIDDEVGKSEIIDEDIKETVQRLTLPNEKRKAIDMPDEAFLPFELISGTDDRDFIYAALHPKDGFELYFMPAFYTLFLVREYKVTGSESDLALAEETMALFIETFKEAGCFPSKAYGRFEEGWVSSMDAPTIMLASQLLFELTENEIYQVFVEDLKNIVF